MAKVKPTTPTLAARYANTMYSTQPSGTTSMKVFTDNFGTKSQTFHQMNNSIVNLDNRYKGLTTPTQNDWEAAVPYYAGIQVCGCDGTIDSGQKLFRLVNYAREIVGQPDTTVPPLLTSSPVDIIDQMTWVKVGPATTWFIIIDWNDTIGGALAIFQTGQGNGNPYLYFPDRTPYNVVQSTDAAYTQLTALWSNPSIRNCGWQTGFKPIGMGTTGLVTSP
jgi:hypothetical protein